MSGKRGLLTCLLAGMLLLTSCAPQTVNPLIKNEATAVPGLSMQTHAAQAGDAGETHENVTLYFRYLDEPMLAMETRTLTVPRDESLEYAIVSALVEGPSAGHSDLRRLLPANTQVESVAAREDTLFVTLNEGFLEDDVPDHWQDSDTWRSEAPLLRRLIVQSIVASITERFAYTGVQILVHRPNDVQASLRLENAYFLSGAEGLSDPVTRDESLLLTPGNTATIILTAWQQKDTQRLYLYVSEEGKPSYAAMAEAIANGAVPTSFTVSGGNVSEDGSAAALTLKLRMLNAGESVAFGALPLHLIRENGVWKITYARLMAMATL